MHPARPLAGLGSALLLGVATALVGPLAGPASAAVCGPGDGVSVVVDARGMDGALASACDAGGAGQTGDVIVPRAGYPITYVQRQPGFVCRVSGAPASDPCVNTPPADAYWGLFWSDGKSGTWSYASTGITGLRIPAGGSIGLAWQDGSGRKVPGIAPPVASSAPSPKPSPDPKPGPTGTPPSSSGGGTTGSGGAAGSTGPGATTGRRASTDTRAATGETDERAAGRDRRRDRRRVRAAARAETEASASATPSVGEAETDEPGLVPAEESDAVPTASQDGAQEGGLPLAVPLVLLGLLAALAVGAAVRRRRGTGTV